VLHCVVVINSKADPSPFEHIGLVSGVGHTAGRGLLRNAVKACLFLIHIVFSIQKIFPARSVFFMNYCLAYGRFHSVNLEIGLRVVEAQVSLLDEQ